MTLLAVVVAHPDDETFACGSVLLRAAARGVRTVVVCATRGEAGEVHERAHVPPGGVAAIREAELRAAASSLGVDDVVLLDFLDSGMEGPCAPDTLSGAPFAEVVESLAHVLAPARPDVVVTLDGSDGHRDHLRVRDAVAAVLDGTDTPLYLHALPRSLMREWVRHHEGDAAAAAYTSNPSIGTPDAEVTTVLDASDHYAARLEAIALHRSQGSPFDDLPEDLRRAFLATDHLVRVRPPWTGGEPEHELLGLPRD
ncbi:PIG-L family deacetylase [Phycicoccus sp. M110.8]|uniref:PIG-L deacetylase family protein n=1 Tax=Phycicoccus sp. M110.8 TaxID=3075433 RepID=UPI0028FD8F57|nr:PIG-L family deacetylase [Phycicoccus sp. M110.8]MDU0313743.1 PIG-L family deacetylase [Phycicoccus sp. M110.8]